MTSPAIVLTRALTGLATVRSLGQAGVPVHVVYFDPADPVRFSRHVRSAVWFDESVRGPDALVECIEQMARRIGKSPPLFPTSDRDALLLANHRDRLASVVRLWATAAPRLHEIVSKNLLYRCARARSLPLIPDCAGPHRDDYERWANVQPGPYIVKPNPTLPNARAFSRKNYIVADAAALLACVDEYGSANVVAQRVVAGGDGYIFDTYGLTSESGALLTIASHRRWRQCAPDYGATSLGEIPVRGMDGVEAKLFEHTSRLLDGLGFHGIFGIEWLMDRDSGEFYVIDFNARPFLSIGHLTDSGMNLPHLAYLDLVGQLPPLERTPVLRHMFWVDLLRDLDARAAQAPAARLRLPQYLAQLMRCRSFGYLSVSDPLPAIARAAELLRRIFASLFLKSRFR
jgi:D-aspartate ligase